MVLKILLFKLNDSRSKTEVKFEYEKAEESVGNKCIILIHSLNLNYLEFVRY